MVIGVQQNVAENDTVLPTQVVKTNPLGGVAEPVSFNYQQPSAAAKKQAIVEQQRRFQALLSDHHQQVKLNAFVETETAEAEVNKEKVEDIPQ